MLMSAQCDLLRASDDRNRTKSNSLCTRTTHNPLRTQRGEQVPFQLFAVVLSLVVHVICRTDKIPRSSRDRARTSGGRIDTLAPFAGGIGPLPDQNANFECARTADTIGSSAQHGIFDDAGIAHRARRSPIGRIGRPPYRRNTPFCRVRGRVVCIVLIGIFGRTGQSSPVLCLVLAKRRSTYTRADTVDLQLGSEIIPPKRRRSQSFVSYCQVRPSTVRLTIHRVFFLGSVARADPVQSIASPFGRQSAFGVLRTVR